MTPLVPFASQRLPRVLYDLKYNFLRVYLANSVFFAHTPFFKAHPQLCISSAHINSSVALALPPYLLVLHCLETV